MGGRGAGGAGGRRRRRQPGNVFKFMAAFKTPSASGRGLQRATARASRGGRLGGPATLGERGLGGMGRGPGRQGTEGTPGRKRRGTEEGTGRSEGRERRRGRGDRA